MKFKDGKLVGELENFEFLIGGMFLLAKRDYSERWASENPVLAKGELAYDFDESKFKRGDGITPWNSLGWFLEVVE